MGIPTKVSGKVLLYTSRKTAEPPLMMMRREVTPNLPAVLRDLSGHYSPIQSEFLFYFNYLIINYFVEFNYCIYVQEDDLWSGKGRFKNAVQDFEPVKWNANIKGEMSLSILTVIILFFDFININLFLLGC